MNRSSDSVVKSKIVRYLRCVMCISIDMNNVCSENVNAECHNLVAKSCVGNYRFIIWQLVTEF